MNEQEIRARIEKRVSQQAEYIIHLLAYIIVNPMLWLVWLMTSNWLLGFPWPLLVTLGWTLGLIAHTVDVFKGRLVDYLTDRELRKLAGYAKPKRLNTLVNDGELAVWEEEEPRYQEVRGR